MGILGDILGSIFSGSNSGGSNRGTDDYKARRVEIQAMQPGGGTWITVGNADGSANNGYFLTMAMENAQRQFPDHRIRAVDGHGRLLDML